MTDGDMMDNKRGRRKQPVKASRLEELLVTIRPITDTYGADAAVLAVRQLKRLGKISPEEAREVMKLAEYKATKKKRGKKRRRSKR